MGSRQFLSCNGPGFGPFQMAAGVVRSFLRSPGWFQFPESSVALTYQGRYAIDLICQSLRIGPGDEVIMPAYNCGAEVDPFVSAGAKVVFYRVDNKAAVHADDIASRVTASTRLIYVTHFFGWPQEIRDLASWCRDKGLFLVEDCALSLFSRGPDNSIGQVGDAAVYSFVKSLPLPDGGALVWRGKDFGREAATAMRSPQSRRILENSLPLLKKWVMHSNSLWQRFEFTRRLLSRSWKRKGPDTGNLVDREMPRSNYFDRSKIGWSISRLSRGILSGVEPQRIFEIRRRNYQHLHDRLSGISSVSPLFDYLPDGVCPLSFPVFVANRSRWCDALEERGILVGGWPSYHKGFDWRDFPEARHLKDDLLTLPVHQELNERHMEYIAESVRIIAEDYADRNSR